CKSGQNSDLLNTMVRAPSWDFSKIPTYASGEGTHVPMPGPFTIRRLQRPPQTKLKIGDVSDPLEREADRVADDVTAMSGADVALTSLPREISRKCVACKTEEDEEKRLQKASDGTQTDAGNIDRAVEDVLRLPGQALDAASRAYFGPR